MDFSFASEFEGAKFNDKRLVRQVGTIADATFRCPESSIPTFLGSESGAEALYRLMKNKKVSASAILQPHINKTVLRAAGAGFVLLPQDSTTHGYKHDSKRQGLGEIAGGGLGFLSHVSIAVDELTGAMLGVVHHTTIVRPLPAEAPAAAVAGEAVREQQAVPQVTVAKSAESTLALLMVVAWKLLTIRTIARTTPEAPATLVLTAQQVKCLQMMHNLRHPKKPLPAKPTMKEAMYAIAGLAGHFKQNGDPGWQILSRGLRRLFQAEEDAVALAGVVQPRSGRAWRQ